MESKFALDEPPRICEECKEPFYRKLQKSRPEFKRQRYCSNECANKGEGRQRHEKYQREAEEWLEEVKFFADLGDTPYTIARMLGLAPRTIARKLYRLGEDDLAARFEKLARQDQAAENPCVECGGPGPRVKKKTGLCPECARSYGGVKGSQSRIASGSYRLGVNRVFNA